MEIIDLMKNSVKGVSYENYSSGETSEAIRNALLEANGGSTKLSIKTFYRGSQLFSLVEELIPTIIDEGFKDDDALMGLIEYRNIAEGDEQEFVINPDTLFIVADAASGIQGVRRQRIDNTSVVTVKTSMKMIRVYEELNRLLSGKVDFNKFIDNVAKSYKQKIYSDAYKALEAVTTNTQGFSLEYIVASTKAKAEDALLALIEHVEAATGKTARILGTKAALRKVPNATLSDEAKSDLYNIGHFGKFNGTEMVSMRQVHKPGTNTFALSDSKLYVTAGDDKFIKVVNEGEGYIGDKEASDNNDLTKEYIYGQAAGVAVVASQKTGIFTFSD